MLRSRTSSTGKVYDSKSRASQFVSINKPDKKSVYTVGQGILLKGCPLIMPFLEYDYGVLKDGISTLECDTRHFKVYKSYQTPTLTRKAVKTYGSKYAHLFKNWGGFRDDLSHSSLAL